jgi:hypothetical protein
MMMISPSAPEGPYRERDSEGGAPLVRLFLPPSWKHPPQHRPCRHLINTSDELHSIT